MNLQNILFLTGEIIFTRKIFLFLQSFIYAYNVFLSNPMPQFLPSISSPISPLLSLLKFVCFLFKHTKSTYAASIREHKTSPWSLGSLPMQISLEKIDSHFASGHHFPISLQLWAGLHEPFPFHNEVLDDLVFPHLMLFWLCLGNWLVGKLTSRALSLHTSTASDYYNIL